MHTITAADRIINALRHYPERPADAPESMTDEQCYRAHEALRGIDAQGRAWNWVAVEVMLDRAYRAIGAQNPGTGHDYHCGTHPVQLAEAEINARIEAEYEAASERYRACKSARIAHAEAARTAARRAVAV